LGYLFIYLFTEGLTHIIKRRMVKWLSNCM